MRIRQIRVVPKTWSDQLSRSRDVLVHVSFGGKPVPEALASGLSARAPELSIVLLDQGGPIPGSFWPQHFRTRSGPLKRQGSPGRGFYLFRDGLVIAHHAGGAHADAKAILTYLGGFLGEVEDQAPDDGWVYDEYVEPGGTRRQKRSRTAPRPAVQDPYEVLGVAETCTDDELRQAYKEAIKANHPDRVAHLSAALQAFALAQTLAIREAWDVLSDERGL